MACGIKNLAVVLGLARGDLAWRDIVNPKTKPFTA